MQSRTPTCWYGTVAFSQVGTCRPGPRSPPVSASTATLLGVDEWIRRQLADAPPLSDEQRAQIRTLLSSVRNDEKAKAA